MANVPYEIARARMLLRQASPLPGGKARVYQRVIGRASVSAPLGLRVAFGAMCLAGSTSALALGYQWINHHSEMPLTVAVPKPIAPKVPPKHRSGAPALASAVAPAASLTTEPVTPPSLAKRPVPPVAAVAKFSEPVPASRGGVQSGAANALPPSTQNQARSELSLQVHEYREAVAPMRSEPQLALARLQAFRSRWQRSAISEEVDLRIVEALRLLGRQPEAAAAARHFLRNYPRSAHAGEMLRISGSASTPND